MRNDGEVKKKNNVLKNIQYIVRMVNEYDSKIIVFGMIRNALEKGFYSFFFVYFIMFLYDLIEQESNYTFISIFLGAVCLAQIGVYILSNQHDYYVQVNTPKIVQGIYLKIFKQALLIPLEKVENPEYYGKYTRALDNAQNSIMQIVSLLGDAFGQIIRLCLLIAIAISIDPILLLFPVLCIVNSVIVSFIRSGVEYRQRKELSEYERKCGYCKRVFYERKYAQELRLYKIGDKVTDLYQNSIFELQRIRKSYLLRLALFEIWDKFMLRLCLLVGACIYLAYKVIVLKVLSVGEFAGAMAAISNVSYCTGFLSYYLGELFKQGADCYNLIAYMEDESQDCIKENEGLDSFPLQRLDIKNLKYSYEKNGTLVLDDVSFAINKGEKIAIAGYNGAGKTTLVKILLGLYKEYEGKVFWNGISIGRFNTKKYKKCVNSVLQDFSIYELSIANNVTMSSSVDEKEKIAVALKEAGVWDKICKLPKGIESSVTKELDPEGVNFSGGELQKIALARIFYNDNADLFILDEPTSAMDPISEFNAYKNLFRKLKDKTMLFVSHRLLTCTMADRILMMDHGKIVEQGSHEELMKLNGKYAEMYRIQSSKINSIMRAM